MCRVGSEAMVPVHVVFRSLSDAVQLITIQAEQIGASLPEHQIAARAALEDALNTAALLREQLAAIHEGMSEPVARSASTMTLFNGGD